MPVTKVRPAEGTALMRGFTSPLSLPGIVDRVGDRVAYERLTLDDRALLAGAITDHRDEVARQCNERLRRLTGPSTLRIAGVEVRK